jgi:diacylglycerol kinase family enzyme
MHSLVIINNAAAKARRSWPNIKKQLDSAGLKFDTYETKEPGDAIVKTREALNNGITTIAVVGGDGTLSEVAEGFFSFNDDLDVAPIVINPNAKLALFPAGTGDDFARDYGVSVHPLQSWVDTLFLKGSECSECGDCRCNYFQNVSFASCFDWELAKPPRSSQAREN